jgi:hypothetical protein
MKTFFKITSIIIFSVFCFTSCDNETLSEDIELNDTTVPGVVNVPEEDILGSWELADHTIEINQIISVNIEGEQISATQNINIDQQSGDITINFEDNGEYTSEGNATVQISGTQDGVSIPESTETIDTPFLSGTWSISNGILTMSNSDGSTELLIISYSGSNMVLFTNENQPVFTGSSFSSIIPDVSEIPGLGDFLDVDFDIDQNIEAEFNLTKLD